jgi:hypothetical protein
MLNQLAMLCGRQRVINTVNARLFRRHYIYAGILGAVTLMDTRA